MDRFIALGLFVLAGAIFLKDRKPMTKLTDAVNGLLAEVSDSNTKLDSIRAFIVGVPALVAAAVADALAAADVEAEEAAGLIDEARTEISDKVDAALNAIDANTGEDTQPGEDTNTGPVGEDTQVGGQGEDSLNG